MKKVILVGASGGIGYHIAEKLLNEGYFVIGTFNDNEAKLSSFLENKNFQPRKVDIENVDSIKNFYEEISSNGEIYALVNASGIVEYEDKSFEEDLNIWNKTININLTSNFIFAKLFSSLISENGRFIMISSTDSFYGGSITSAYSASKAGVNSLAKSLSLLFKDKKIRVNSVAPGWVSTPMIEINGGEFLKKVAEINPLKRIAEPQDIANFVSFLLSEQADYINGQTITIDGGYTNQDPTLLLEEDLH